MSRSPSELVRQANRVLLEDGGLETEAFFSSSYRVHTTGGTMDGGPSWIRTFVQSLRTAFAPLTVDIEILAEDGDRVAWRRRLQGTHGRPFQGFPPTGQTVEWCDLVVSRVTDGQIVEEWAVSDLAEQLLRGRTGRSG